MKAKQDNIVKIFDKVTAKLDSIVIEIEKMKITLILEKGEKNVY